MVRITFKRNFDTKMNAFRNQQFQFSKYLNSGRNNLVVIKIDEIAHTLKVVILNNFAVNNKKNWRKKNFISQKLSNQN